MKSLPAENTLWRRQLWNK